MTFSPPESPLSSSPSSSLSSHDHLLPYRESATTTTATATAGHKQRPIRMMERGDSIRSSSKKDLDETLLGGRKASDTEQNAGAEVSTVPVRSTDRTSRDSDLTLADLFDASKTAKENKSTLMSYELDRMQLGRYQLFVFFLCGLGYFIDLMWAQALGLIATPLKFEPGFGADNSTISTLSVAFNVGLTVGAFTWGILVDVVGRRWSFYLTCLISGIFGIGAGGSNSFTTLRIITAFVGFGVGGNIPIDATITMESLPTNRRFLLVLLSLFQPVGVLVASGIAYGYIPSYTCQGGNASLLPADGTPSPCSRADNTGWRYYLYTLGAITVAIFLIRFLVFKFRESPAFLINRGRDAEALKVVEAITKVNRAPPPLFTMDDFCEIDRRCASIRGRPDDEDEDERELVVSQSAVDGKRESLFVTIRRASSAFVKQFKNLRILFRSWTMARVTVLLWITYICDFWGFNIAGFFLPQILAERLEARGAKNSESLSDTYRDYVAIYAPGIAACLLGGLLIEVPRLGRRWSMVISSALMAISMFLYTVVDTQSASVGLNLLEYFMQSLFNAILYAYTPEVYPSAIRGSAAGFTSTLGRISGIVAPLAAGPLYGAGGNTPEERIQAIKNVLYLGGGVTLACPIALALLPFDTRGVRSY